MERAIVYTTPTWPYCRHVKEFLGSKGVPYEERDVGRDQAAAEEMVRRTGQMGVPVTSLGGEMVVGFDRPRLERLIQRLQTAPKPATLGAAVKDAPDGGILVGMVHPGTPAERGGLKTGDIIVAVDETPVAGVDALARLVQAARERGNATMMVRRAGTPLHLRIPFTTPWRKRRLPIMVRVNQAIAPEPLPGETRPFLGGAPAQIATDLARLRSLDADHVFFATGYAPSLDEQVRLLEHLQRAVQACGG